MLVVFSWDHTGKPGRWDDRGAHADLDGDGYRAQHETEVYRTPFYFIPAMAALAEAGIESFVMADGWYRDRWARLHRYLDEHDIPRAVYVACHLNAGGGSYGLVGYHHRTPYSGGVTLARRIARQLGRACPELSRARAEAAAPDNAWRRMHGTIAGLDRRVIGICYEPAFVDQPDHAPLLTGPGLQRVGEALAAGIIDYIRPQVT